MATDPARVYPSVLGGSDPHLIIHPFYKDPTTGALYLFNGSGYSQVADPWNEEDHVGPIVADEVFGDVESWARYLLRHTPTGRDPHITWSSKGLLAVLDYHDGDRAGRCDWKARQPFVLSSAYAGWKALADGRPKSQDTVVKWIESHIPDIVDPPAGELIQLLSTLRTTVNKAGGVKYNEDGTSIIEYRTETTAGGRGGIAPIPPELRIAIQILRGHVEQAPDLTPGVPRVDAKTGQPIMQPVLYGLTVRQRVIPNNDNKPEFFYEIPLLDRALEDVYADLVRRAQSLLGDFDVLRGGET